MANFVIFLDESEIWSRKFWRVESTIIFILMLKICWTRSVFFNEFILLSDSLNKLLDVLHSIILIFKKISWHGHGGKKINLKIYLHLRYEKGILTIWILEQNYCFLVDWLCFFVQIWLFFLKPCHSIWIF